MFGLRYDRFRNHKFHLIREHYGYSCLDVGSGDGDFAVFLQSEGILTTAIDIADKGEHPEMQTKIFDGRKIPFPAKSFDTSIAMFVLHYSQDPMQLLNELGRVTRSRIIIGEDVTDTALDKVLSRLHMWTTPWGRSRGVFYSDEKWRKIFQSRGSQLLKVIEIPRYLEPTYPIHRRIYVIEP